MSRSSANACCNASSLAEVGQQSQLDLRVVRRQQRPALRRQKRLANLSPLSLRMGMFCKFGSLLTSRPVDATV